LRQAFDRPAIVTDYFLTHHEEEDIYLSLHALLNCLSEDEIGELYFEHCAVNPELKRSVESYIHRHSQTRPRRSFDKIARRLLAAYPKESYDFQIKVRVFLTGMVRNLSTQTIKTFFDLFITSQRVIDRRRAGEVADLIFSDEVEGKLWDNYYQHRDEESLIPLVRCLPPNDLCKHMKNCWTATFPSYRIKNQVIDKISAVEVTHLAFLKKRDPSYYVRAMVLKGRKVAAGPINRLKKTLPDDQQKFIVWYLGLTQNWDLVWKHLNLPR